MCPSNAAIVRTISEKDHRQKKTRTGDNPRSGGESDQLSPQISDDDSEYDVHSDVEEFEDEAARKGAHNSYKNVGKKVKQSEMFPKLQAEVNERRKGAL